MTARSIKRESNKAAAKAAKLKWEPLMAFEDEDIACEWMPNIGNYRPKGWKLIRTYFVDNFGFGREYELALTVNQFLTKVKAGFGYAIIEEGQFQLYVGEFKKGK